MKIYVCIRAFDKCILPSCGVPVFYLLSDDRTEIRENADESPTEAKKVNGSALTEMSQTKKESERIVFY